MRSTCVLVISAATAALFLACTTAGDQTSSSTASSSSGAGGGSACAPCVTERDCPAGSHCGQFGGDTYCAPDCSQSACSSDRACTQVASAEGNPVQICIPRINACGGAVTGAGGGASAASSSSGGAETCGSLDGPDIKSCCTSCKNAGQPCQANGCYSGWWCNTDTCKCQAPPSPGACGGGAGSGGGPGDAGAGGSGGSVGVNGGTLDTLSFAIVGDTRPPNIDDTAGYPSAVIQKIWQEIEGQSPRPAFAITTGDYMFAKPSGNQAGAQLGLYLSARAAFTNTVFPAMGNHECTGATASNCGPGNADGVTVNYTAFLAKLIQPLGQSHPYYTVNIGSTNNTWTAKLVFVAANAWDATQASWFAAEMAKPTTYTFVVRHEGSWSTTAPGVTPSAQIMSQHPYTLLIAGHTHTFEYVANEREVIVGNGGAPLTGAINYGYVVARQRADGAIQLKEFDYSTNAVQQTFTVKPDGTPTP